MHIPITFVQRKRWLKGLCYQPSMNLFHVTCKSIDVNMGSHFTRLLCGGQSPHCLFGQKFHFIWKSELQKGEREKASIGRFTPQTATNAAFARTLKPRAGTTLGSPVLAQVPWASSVASKEKRVSMRDAGTAGRDLLYKPQCHPSDKHSQNSFWIW